MIDVIPEDGVEVRAHEQRRSIAIAEPGPDVARGVDVDTVVSVLPPPGRNPRSAAGLVVGGCGDLGKLDGAREHRGGELIDGCDAHAVTTAPARESRATSSAQ